MIAETTPPNKKILAVYIALAVSLLLGFVPHMAFSCAALFGMVGTMVLAYVFRAEDKDTAEEADGLVAHHMTWIIRTVWIVVLFAHVTIVAGALYMIPRIDNAPMDSCVQAIAAGLTPDNPDYKAANALVQPCLPGFIETNWRVFMISLLISGGPLVLYVLYRWGKGISAAWKGARLAKLKSWF
ncbi:MAG: hypothetical protein KDJ15_04990 [Alphaproteobacteria bacterium]|nr:hypothetical protein [Alphaproteobacteria bacterium]